MLIALLLLCSSGGAGAYVLLKDDVEEIAAATEIRVVTPDQLAGRPRIVRPELQKSVESSTADLKRAVPSITSTVGAAYGDPDRQDVLLVIAASTVTLSPGKSLDRFIAGMRDAGLDDLAMTSIPPGPLGGVAKCGDANAADSVEMGVCVWADRGSFGLITMYFKTGDDVQAEFVAIRGAVEKTG